jgi:eukaryotic-like serine/threonine-protein kinase
MVAAKHDRIAAMLSVPRDDDSLRALLGAEIPSDVGSRVVYRIVSRVGEGAMSHAFYALRVGPEGETPVVVKILKPSFVRQFGPTAALIVKKEAIALGRLNERIPPTPFVVRFIDVGQYQIISGKERLGLPWVVVEYVHGGAEGTTLTERVAHTLQATGTAFEPLRAAHLVECLGAGLMAVQEMGVIHRDVKPDNVLCCGFDDGEIFKIADFGVARPSGISGTFGGMVVGTLGYAAPELATQDQKSIGPWSDVFSFACVIFYVLTGEHLFTVSSPAQAIVAACDPLRRSIRDARALARELRAKEQACRSIDFAIACATSAKIELRPQRADALAAMIVPWLQIESERKSQFTRRLDRIREVDELTQLVGWSWTTVRSPDKEQVVRSVAWDGDGRCMTATSRGLSFWNGSTWHEASLEGFPNPRGLRFVRRVAAGRWIVGGDDATFATYTSDGVGDIRHLRGEALRFDLLSGELHDLAVLVGETPEGPPTLCALSANRWLKPLPLPDVAAITSLARIEDARWLICGRDVGGEGFAAIYTPLRWEVTRMSTPAARAFLACAGQFHWGVGLAAGQNGAVLWWRDGQIRMETIPGATNLSAAGVDAVGRGWVAGAGKIWIYRAGAAATGQWVPIWSDPSFTAPIISLFTDLGVVIAMTADGGIIEGRAQEKSGPESSVRGG